MEKEVEKTIEKTLAQIITFFPYFGIIIGSWKDIVLREDIPTIATDGDYLYYNPEFVTKITNQELFGVMLHEIMHCVFLHPYEISRFEDQSKENKLLWIWAQEIVTNAGVLDVKSNLSASVQHIVQLPGTPFSPFDDEIAKENSYIYDKRGHTQTAGEIYNELLNKYKDKIISIPLPLLARDVLPAKDKRNTEEGIMRAIAVIEKIKRLRGDLPEGLKRFFDKLTKSRIRWSNILHNLVGRRFSEFDELSWNKPDWRHMPSDEVIFPGPVSSKGEDDVVVAVDTSGSITDRQIAEFASEIQKLMQYVSDVTVLTCDAKVHEKVKVTHAGELIRKLNFKGGGGTDFRPVFETVRTCAMLIFLTDGEGTYPEKKPPYPVVWILTDDSDAKPPFGKVIQMPKNDEL